MLISNHGGNCCGVNHLYNFYSPLNFTADHVSALRERVSRVREGVSIEVVLTDAQSAQWAPSLVKIGFKPVFRFRNSNSRRLLTVFFYHPSPLSLENLPFSTNPEDAPGESKPLKEYPTVGDHLRVLNPRARWYGRSVTVVSVDKDRARVGVRLHHEQPNLCGFLLPLGVTEYFKLGSLGK